MLQANSSAYLDQASAYTYTPARQLAAVTKSGVDKGDDESYEYDAAGNTTKQTIGATTSTMTYDRNRLTKTVTGSTTVNQRYDVFGRATTSDVNAQVVEQNAYDGYDRLTRQQKFDTTGTPTSTRNQTYDPFDRVSSQSEKVGTAQSVTTRYTFVGLATQVAIEQEQDTAGTWKTSKSYAYGANGENLSLVDSPVNGATSKKSFYGTNPHGDVETLTDASTGTTTSTYRYTAYGQPDKKGTTGDDAITGDASQDADIVNPYRFNSARFDGATGTYDMGFREYNPGLNRFLTRDMFNGALSDLGLGTDPWNANRYMFGGGNPISRIELNGHMNAIEDTGGGMTPRPTPPPVEPEVPDTKPTQPSTGEKIAGWFAPGQFEKNVTNELVVKPIQETYEACKAAVMTGVGSAGWQQCQIGIGLTALSFTGAGKVVGIGVRTVEGLAAARAEAAGASILTGRAAMSAAGDALRAAVDKEAARIVAAQSIRQRGPVLTGALDRQTGKIYFGQNTGIPSPLHPQLEAALERFAGPGPGPGPGPGAAGKGIPGTHSEFNAINQGLFARPGSSISDFTFYSVRLRGAAQGDQIMMCPNRANILKGAEDLNR